LEIVFSTVRLYVKPYMVFYEATPVPGGYNVTYQHPVDFTNGSVVQCRIYCKDIHGNILDYSWEFKINVQAVYFNIDIHPGWNLISLPFDTYNMSVGEVLSSISGKYDAVKMYAQGAADGPWLGYWPERAPELNRFTIMDRKVGYWVHAKEQCTLKLSGVPATSTSITLHAGWNLVGYPTMDGTKTLSGALWGTNANRAEGFNPTSPYVKVLTASYVMKPGQAFWIRVPADVVWVINW
jgi:hypothetical protein